MVELAGPRAIGLRTMRSRIRESLAAFSTFDVEQGQDLCHLQIVDFGDIEFTAQSFSEDLDLVSTQVEALCEDFDKVARARIAAVRRSPKQRWKPRCGSILFCGLIEFVICGGRLNFNSPLHILVSAGGLQESEGRWIARLAFDQERPLCGHHFLQRGATNEGAHVRFERGRAKNRLDDTVP
ncbi:MAG: hypothetical protein ACLQDM_27510 [Bradyrhizobium sp.]